MQSFLQYRRFRKHVVRQYERDKSKAEALANSAGSGLTSPSGSDSLNTPEITDAREPIDTRDPEKGEQSNGQSYGAQHHVQAHDPEKGEGGEDQGQGYAPLQTAPTAARASRDGEVLGVMSRVATVPMGKHMGTALGTTLTGIDVRDRSTEEGGDGKVFVVGYEGENDMMNPHNWSSSTRLAATFNISCIAIIVVFASSVDSAALMQATADFGVSDVTESLATGIFLIGFGVGALFAGPVSETVGRNPVYIATLSLYMIFIMASALAPNIGAQLAFRFIAGCFAATPLVCSGGSLSDLWNPMERIYAFPVFATAAFMGPVFGPVVGGFVGESPIVSWRWCEWITLIVSGLVLTFVLLLQPQTYAPTLLKWKATHLRQLTGDDRYKAEIEIRYISFPQRLGTALYRPFVLTFSEPIIILMALYLAVVYIILFSFFNGYTFIFTETYGFSQGATGLAFIGIAIGLCFALLLVPIIYKWAKDDLAKIEEQGGTQLPPESKLWFAVLGAPAIPISMFWMVWTDYSWISYWSPLGASVLFGYGSLGIFISSYQYIIDSYELHSASALASATLIRFVASGGMVEVAIPFYRNLGVHWTLTILGALSTLLVPVPYLFYHFGTKIRARSKYAVVK